MKAFKKIILSGNEAMAEGAISAGCRFYAGYPITPQNEIPAYFARRMPEVGGVFIQAESELAAINMVLGASTTGAMAMTSSSSPGISLKQEGISYLAGCRLPAVILNVMRGGPGLGNISSAQSDYFQAVKGGGHGDYHMIVLGPWNVQEAYELTAQAFVLADKYRLPVMLLADGMLGQMLEPLEIKNNRKQTKAVKPWVLTGAKNRPARVIRSLYLGEHQLEDMNIVLQNTYEKIKADETKFEEFQTDDADIVVVSYGTMARICLEAVEELRDNRIKAGLFRLISLWPFPSQELKKISLNKKVLVVEMSCGQMVEDVRLSLEGQSPVYFLGRTGGGMPSKEEIVEKINQIKAKVK